MNIIVTGRKSKSIHWQTRLFSAVSRDTIALVNHVLSLMHLSPSFWASYRFKCNFRKFFKCQSEVSEEGRRYSPMSDAQEAADVAIAPAQRGSLCFVRHRYVAGMLRVA